MTSPLHRRSVSIAAMLLASLGLLASCGGGGGRSEARKRTPVAAETSGASTPNPQQAGASSESSAPAPVASTPEPFTVGGTAGLWKPGASGMAESTPAVSARTCTIPDLWGTCVAGNGAGGPFVVTMTTPKDDVTNWSATVHCGTTPAVPFGAATVRGSLKSTDLSFDGYGDVTAITLTDTATNATEIGLVYAPQGAKCPRVFGLGAAALTSDVRWSTGQFAFSRPTGSTVCVKADPASGGFALTEQATNSCE